MAKDLELIDKYMDYRYEFVSSDSSAYYRKIYEKLKKDISKEEIVKIINNINNKYIKTFIMIMKNSDKGQYLNNLYSNLRITKIIECSLIQTFIAKNSGTCGGNYYKNGMILLLLGDKINLDGYSANLTPYHELLHLLTTKIESENIISIGFSSNSFCEGLNEGYTEILTKRYFGHLSSDDEEFYQLHSWYSEMIEEILGKDILEKCYFGVDQNSLIKELAKYSNIKDVIELICNTDYLFECEEKIFTFKNSLYIGNKINHEELEMLCKESEFFRDSVFTRLIEIHKNKFKNLLEKKVIDEKKYQEEIDKYYKKHEKIKRVIDNNYQLYNEFNQEKGENKKWKSLIK